MVSKSSPTDVWAPSLLIEGEYPDFWQLTEEIHKEQSNMEQGTQLAIETFNAIVNWLLLNLVDADVNSHIDLKIIENWFKNLIF